MTRTPPSSNLFLRPILFAVSVLLLPTLSTADERCATEQDDCTFAVFPYSHVRQMSSTYTEVANDFSLVMDKDVRLIGSRSTHQFVDNFKRGIYDIALTSNVSQILFGEEQGYLPIARRKLLISYRIITRQDSDIHKLQDLRDKTLGLSELTFSASTVALYLLHMAGIDRSYGIKLRHLSTQPTCAYALISGLIDACGVASPVLSLIMDENPGKFRSIARSKLFTNAHFVVHRDVPKDKRQQLTEYLINRPGYIPSSDADLASYRYILKVLAAAPPLFP